MDRYTWRQPWDQSLPLPFDSEYRPKPAWTATQEALHPTGAPPPSPPPPPTPPPTPPPAESPTPSAPVTVDAQHASSAVEAPLTLSARLRRQRLRTWLARRALAAQVQVSGSQSAGVDLVARVRSRVIGRATTQLVGGEPHAVQISLTTVGGRRLRDARRARVLLTAVAIDADGRRSSAVSRIRPG